MVSLGLFIIIFSLLYTSHDTVMQSEVEREGSWATNDANIGILIVFAFIIIILINSIINLIIFLIGLRILDRFGEGGLWLNPKQTIIKALWFIPSITLVTMLLRFLPIIGWILGLIAWFIALKLVYRMEWYEMLILTVVFSFAGLVIGMIGLTQAL